MDDYRERVKTLARMMTALVLGMIVWFCIHWWAL